MRAAASAPCGRAAARRARAPTPNTLLSGDGGGTRFDYHNEFRAPLGPVGALVSRALVGGMPQREANRTLQALKEQVEQGR